MRKKIFTILLVLAASVGMSWATENSIVINGTPQVGDNSISLTYYFDPANVPGITGFAPTLKVKCAADNKWDEEWLSLSEIRSGTTTITLEELGSFQEGKSYDVCFAYYNGSWVDDVFQSFTPAAPTPAGNSITINESAHGSVVASSSSAAAGETITLTATPDDGYQLKSISGVYEAQATSSETINFDKTKTTVTGTKFQCVGTAVNNYGWRVYNPGTANTLTVSSKDGATLITKIEFTSTWGNGRKNNMLSVSAGTLSFDGNDPSTTVTINGINATSVTISGSGSNAGQTWCINSVKVYYTATIENDLEISDTENANVKTFTMVDSEVTISAEFEPAPTPTPSETAARFVYNYDCQRNPPYPQAGSPCNLSGFSDPLVGYTGIGIRNKALGPWKLEFVGYYTPSNHYDCEYRVISAVNSYYPTLSDEEKEAKCLEVPIFRLWQYNLAAKEYQHASYGIICAYAAEANAQDHGALFISSESWGCFLTGHQHTSSFQISCENDLTTGMADLVAAASAPSDPYYDVVWPVIVSIDAIGDVELTQFCKDQIEGSRAAFNALTDEQKTQVTNSGTLTDAEAEWADLVAAAQPYADAVIALINAIPNPVVYTQDCKDKIDAAQAAYDALTDGQKILVTNAETLLQAPIAFISAAPSVNIVFQADNSNIKKVEDVTLPRAFATGDASSEMVSILKELYNLDEEYTMGYAYSYSDAVVISNSWLDKSWTVSPFDGTARVTGSLSKVDSWGMQSFTVYISLELPPFAPAPTPNSITINGTPAVGDNSISLTYYFDPANVPGITGYAPTLKVKCVEDGKYDEIWLSLSEISSGTTTITLDNLVSFQEGKSYEVCFAYYTGSWVDEMFQSFSFDAPTPTPAVVIGDPNDADQVTAFLDTYAGQTVPDLTIDRPVLNNMYNTLCLPFHMDADQIAASSLNGVEIYEFIDVDVTNDELYLYTSEQKHEIVAGRPYLVKYSAASQLEDLDFVNVVVDNADLEAEKVVINGVTFKGVFAPYWMDEQSDLNLHGGYLFLGQNNTLYWPNVSNYVKPFRAYFYVDVDNAPAGMPMRRGMPAHIGGPAQIVTGVENVQGDNVQGTKVVENGVLYIIKNGVKYNAQGQIVK